MTMDQALADIGRLSRLGSNHNWISQDEIRCEDMQKAIRLLAEVYDHLRKRGPLYGDRRRFRSLAPPPSSVPPG